ncbi:zf-TFIIB domain-containing protein [Microbacterium sp. YMB-B2]|uniref:Zf-TFIIB domain-containing protein n=1 Tax=Microbacterium tenebrionis TaxID=2830665 RepID=A0A9X1LQX9_9MICO|nr:zf-TFIIB domain-containing protein [Microbacterium ihumii]MCC2030168.1 zf-TFIIB domain-containing protein [Microbacterium tenebrionis]
MKCPVDGADLVVADRSDVEIDYCPQCRGVWLDRGELDKIIDRSAGSLTPDASYRDRRRDNHGGHKRGRGREGFLGDLFDF